MCASCNILQVCGAGGALASETFNRMVMNPSFGEKINLTLTDPDTGESTAFYRHVTERDLWQLDADVPDTEEASP